MGVVKLGSSSLTRRSSLPSFERFDQAPTMSARPTKNRRVGLSLVRRRDYAAQRANGVRAAGNLAHKPTCSHVNAWQLIAKYLPSRRAAGGGRTVTIAGFLLSGRKIFYRISWKVPTSFAFFSDKNDNLFAQNFCKIGRFASLRCGLSDPKNGTRGQSWIKVTTASRNTHESERSNEGCNPRLLKWCLSTQMLTWRRGVAAAHSGSARGPWPGWSMT